MDLFVKYYENYPSVMTVWQVAVTLNISEDKVRSLIRKNELTAYRIGKIYIVAKEDLCKYIKSSRSFL